MQEAPQRNIRLVSTNEFDQRVVDTSSSDVLTGASPGLKSSVESKWIRVAETHEGIRCDASLPSSLGMGPVRGTGDVSFLGMTSGTALMPLF